MSYALASKVNARLESPTRYLNVIADTYAKQGGDDEHITQLLASGVEKFPIFDSIYILDRDKYVKKMSFSALSKYHKSDFYGIKLSDVRGFQDFSVYWSRPFVSLVTGNYIVRVSIQVPSGYIVGDLSLKLIADTLIRAREREYANIFIVDAKGDVVSASDASMSIVQENRFSHPLVKDVYHGGHIVVGYQWGEHKYAGSGFKIPIADWYLILEQREDIAFKLFYEILFVTSISALFVGFFYYCSAVSDQKETDQPYTVADLQK